MTSDDDATRKIRPPRPEPPSPLPGPLDLTQPFARPEDASEPYEHGAASDVGWPREDEAPATEVLEPDVGLDQLFDPPPAAPPVAATAEAPTWTAMPVVPVRSEPVTHAGPAPQRPQRPQRPQMSTRMRSDAMAAWQGGLDRVQTWLRSADNAVLLMTAVVGIVLIAVVAALGH